MLWLVTRPSGETWRSLSALIAFCRPSEGGRTTSAAKVMPLQVGGNDASGSGRHVRQGHVVLEVDAADDALGARTSGQIDVQCRKGVRPFLFGHLEVVVDVDAGDFQNAVDIFYVARHGGLENIFRGPNLLSGQHRGQCAHHSAPDSPDNVVEGSGVLLFGIDFIEFFDPAVDPVINRFTEAFDDGLAGRPLFHGNDDVRSMNNIVRIHCRLLSMVDGQTMPVKPWKAGDRLCASKSSIGLRVNYGKMAASVAPLQNRPGASLQMIRFETDCP